MRTFQDSKYNLLGYELVSSSNVNCKCWIFETKNIHNDPNFQSLTVLTSQARFVTDEGVFYLLADGQIQNNLREECFLPYYLYE